jgi:hypothetical protein
MQGPLCGRKGTAGEKVLGCSWCSGFKFSVLLLSVVLQGSKQGFAKESKDWWCSREHDLKVKFAPLHWQLHVARDKCSNDDCGGKNDKNRKWIHGDTNEGVEGRVKVEESGRQSGSGCSSFVLLGERLACRNSRLPVRRSQSQKPKARVRARARRSSVRSRADAQLAKGTL